MSRWRWSVPAGALVAVLATSALSHGSAKPSADPFALAADGIGPLRLGLEYQAATAAVRRAAPESALAGPGCGGFDEVRFSGRLGDLPVSVMGMAETGQITEIELSLDAPLRASDESACLALRDHLASSFIARFGAPGAAQLEHKPVSREHRLPVGPVVVVARWFEAGRSCYVTALYQAPAAL